MDNCLILQMPEYTPQYKDDEVYGYNNEREKKSLKKVLTEASREYCMYCYNRFVISGSYYGHLEHAIEKGNSVFLEECIPDIGIACSKCNESLKRVKEKKRKLDPVTVEQFHQNAECTDGVRRQCKAACEHLKELQRAYIDNPDGHIILQPMGVESPFSGKKLKIQYNVMSGEFEPYENDTYTREDKEFIWDHIQQFHLNDSSNSREQLQRYLKIVIDSDGKLPGYEYNNYIVQLFEEKISEFTTEKRVKICEKLDAILNVSV